MSYPAILCYRVFCRGTGRGTAFLLFFIGTEQVNGTQWNGLKTFGRKAFTFFVPFVPIV